MIVQALRSVRSSAKLRKALLALTCLLDDGLVRATGFLDRSRRRTLRILWRPCTRLPTA